MMAILGSMINISVGTAGGGTMWSPNEYMNLHFDNKQDIYMSSIIYEEIDYNLNLDLPIILY